MVCIGAYIYVQQNKSIFLRVCGEIRGVMFVIYFNGILYSDVHQEEGESSDFIHLYSVETSFFPCLHFGNIY